MRPIRTYAARSRVTWALWMSLLTIPFVALFVCEVLADAARNAYAMWHWQYRGEVRAWLSNFGEQHRKSLSSLGAKPPQGASIPASRALHVYPTHDRLQ